MVFAGPLSGGKIAVGLVSAHSSAAIACVANNLPLLGIPRPVPDRLPVIACDCFGVQVNKCNGSHKITATWKDIGAKAGTSYSVRDAIAHAPLPDASAAVSATVGMHDIAVLVLTPK
jgi:hypothetical protein